MTTLLKEIGIQQWRLRSVTPVVEPSLDVKDVVLENHSLIENEESISHESSAPTVPVEKDIVPPAQPIANLSIDETISMTPSISPTPLPKSMPDQPQPRPMSVSVPPRPIAMPEAASSRNESAVSASTPFAVDPVELLDWQGLQSMVDGPHLCHTCGSANSILGAGDANANWLFVSDAPTLSDLQAHQLFSGRAGQLYEAMLLAVGLKRSSVYTTSIFKCAASDDLNAAPSCDKLIYSQIGLLSPSVIIAFGEFAAQSLAKTNDPLEVLRMQDLRCPNTQIPIVASYSPLQLLDEPSLKAGAWQDLKKCITIAR